MEDPMSRSFRSGLIGLAALTGLMLTGCGADETNASDEPSTAGSSASAELSATEQASASATPTPAEKAQGTTIDITFKGDTVKPDGAEKKVKAGEPITLHIVADKPGELHIHSSPEQQLEYGPGTTDEVITIDQPGIVEVESHDLDRLVVQLEVR
jgi:hypothetical protein